MFRDGISSRDARRTAAEMKYRRRTAEYIWTDYKKNIVPNFAKKNVPNYSPAPKKQIYLN
jgi:hypothetical protein